MNAFHGQLGAEWLRFRTPRWVAALVLWAGCAGAFAVAIAGDHTTCTPADPNVCGPDVAGGWAIGVLIAVLVLAAIAPVLACLAGLAFSIPDALFDPEAAARFAFGAFAVLCVGLGWVVLSRRRAQRRVFAASEVALPVVASDSARFMSGAVAGRSLVLLLGFAGGLAMYHQRTTTEAMHLRTAQRQQAVVTSVDGSNDVIAVRLADGTTRRVDVLDTGPYSLASTTPVLVDPADASWLRLVAEPADFTMWLSAASCCALLLLTVLGWQAVGARARYRLLSSSAVGVVVRVSIAGPHRVNIHFAEPGSPVAVASFETVAAQHEIAAVCAPVPAQSSDPWRYLREPNLQEATVIGDFADAGWVAVTSPRGVLLPRTTLRVTSSRALGSATPSISSVGRRLTRRKTALDASTLSARTVYASDPAMTVPELPMTVPTTAGSRRLLGWLMSVVGLLGSAVLVAISGRVDAPLGLMPVGAIWFLVGTVMLRAHIVVSHKGFECHAAWRTYVVPWSMVKEVARSSSRLLVAVPKGVLVTPEFAGSGVDERVDGVGRAMTTMRDRARAVGAMSGHVQLKHGLGWPAVAGYAVVVALAFVVGRTLF